MTAEVLAGGCLCGAVRFELHGAPKVVTMCHCSLCRRWSGAPAVAWATFANAQLTLHGEPLKAYRSSPIAQRYFCGTCGSQLLFRLDKGDEVDVTLGAFDHPETLPPSRHIWCQNQVSWFHTAGDGLPRHDDNGS